ncbi:MAG: hypothetical protein JWO31_3136, partial [Phycisphaerales bacterium]|nr:hypothetical protein [Phycisphaerales bacterium]
GVRAAAAVAIGTSRQPTAAEVLRAAFAREPEPDVRRAVLFAAAGTRTAAAVDWLAGIVRDADAAAAVDAIDALGTYRTDEAVRRRVGDAVAAREEPRLTAAFERAFA